MFRKTHLLGKVLNNTVFRHLGANGKAALELLLDAAQHLLVLLGSEALHSCESAVRNWVLENPVHLYWEGQRNDNLSVEWPNPERKLKTEQCQVTVGTLPLK